MICNFLSMKRFIANICIAFGTLLPAFAFGQTTTYVGHYTERSHITNDTLIEKETGTSFILDKGRIYITAIDKTGKQLWKTDPFTDNKMREYRVKRPVIVFFEFEKDNSAIRIVYNNTQFGSVGIKDGSFIFHGQD